MEHILSSHDSCLLYRTMVSPYHGMFFIIFHDLSPITLSQVNLFFSFLVLLLYRDQYSGLVIVYKVVFIKEPKIKIFTTRICCINILPSQVVSH